MGLFSFFRKNKQESTSKEGGFYSHAEEASNLTRARNKRSIKGAVGKQVGEPVDPVLPEKKRARRRLVGAIALVLGVVIVLPMILDSVPKPISGEIEIQIPSKDKIFQERKAQVPAIPASNETLIVSVPKIQAGDTTISGSENPVAPVAGTAGIVTEIKKSKDAPASSGAEKSLQPIPSDSKIDQKNETNQPVSNVTNTHTESNRAKAILENKTDVKADFKPGEPKISVEQKSGKFVIQVAALATQEKVSELQNRLRSAAIKSFTQKIATQNGERIRVRVGPFASKEEAERMRKKLIKSGLSGTLVPV